MKYRDKIQAVVFDMDGLMIDTERLAARGWKEAGEKMGFLIDEEKISQIRGRNLADVQQLFQDWYHGKVNCIEARTIRFDYARNYIRENGVPVKTGLVELLEYLREQEIPAVAASSTERKVVVEELGQADLLKYFDAIICGNEVHRSKPNPEIFLKAMERIQAKPENCIVLEDSFNGIRAGYAAGSRVIMVPDLDFPTEEIRRLCFRICPTLSHVINVLEEEIK